MKKPIGIIGGSGLYSAEGLEPKREHRIATPFGDPSDAYLETEHAGRTVFFLPRHGRGHLFLPSEINHRANIFGFKQLGVECVVAFTAVGSLREEIEPRHILLPDQYIDRTKQNHTFFGNGIVAHVPFGDPVCPMLHRQILEAARRVAATAPAQTSPTIHSRGTYVNIEGPAFSTRAESNLYRAWGCDVVGMTSLPEAKLCREAQLPYAAIALVTDYDCWHASEEAVSAALVTENVKANLAFARGLLLDLIPSLQGPWSKGATDALQGAIMTESGRISAEAKERLSVIL